MFLIHSLLIWMYRTLNFVVVFIQADAVEKSKKIFKVQNLTHPNRLVTLKMGQIKKSKAIYYTR